MGQGKSYAPGPYSQVMSGFIPPQHKGNGQHISVQGSLGQYSTYNGAPYAQSGGGYDYGAGEFGGKGIQYPASNQLPFADSPFYIGGNIGKGSLGAGGFGPPPPPPPGKGGPTGISYTSAAQLAFADSPFYRYHLADPSRPPVVNQSYKTCRTCGYEANLKRHKWCNQCRVAFPTAPTPIPGQFPKAPTTAKEVDPVTGLLPGYVFQNATRAPPIDTTYGITTLPNRPELRTAHPWFPPAPPGGNLPLPPTMKPPPGNPPTASDFNPDGTRKLSSIPPIITPSPPPPGPWPPQPVSPDKLASAPKFVPPPPHMMSSQSAPTATAGSSFDSVSPPSSIEPPRLSPEPWQSSIIDCTNINFFVPSSWPPWFSKALILPKCKEALFINALPNPPAWLVQCLKRTHISLLISSVQSDPQTPLSPPPLLRSLR